MRKRREKNDGPVDPMADPSHRADLEAVVRIVQRGVQKNPEARWKLQRALEEYIKSFTMRDNWRPRWITEAALAELVQTGGVWITTDKRWHPLQRCHGSVPGALSRTERFKVILGMGAAPIEEIWEFFLQHDSSVIALKSEHKSKKVWSLEELIPIPDPPPGAPVLFYEDGMSAAVGPAEVAWAQKAWADRVR